MQKKRDFLITFAYWFIIAAGVYLALEYLLPVSVPFIIGILIAAMVVRISRRFGGPQKLIRLLLTVVVYGIIGVLITLLAAKGVSAVTNLIKWLPQLYEMKLLPFIKFCYNWCSETIQRFDPTLITALQMLEEGITSALKSMVTSMSGKALDIVSGIATGVPSLIISTLTMIFSTVFVAPDYERVCEFANELIPEGVKQVLGKIKLYLTDTVFVVIRSYALIMLLTFAELSVLFSLIGIENAFLKASIIALLDILPILGTGGILIPWAVISLVLGYTVLGIELLAIYAIVTVVRNYVEPKIVGTQLGLHPIITLVSMFIGLRLFGFWGLFGLPVGISFLWKERKINTHSEQKTE